MGKDCAGCGRTNDDDARFCAGCGRPLPVTEVPAAGQSASGPPPVTPSPAQPPPVVPPAVAPPPVGPAQVAAPSGPHAVASGPPVVPPPGQGPAPSGGPAGPGRGAPTWLVVALIVAVIAIAAVAALLFLPFGNNDKGGDKSPSPVATASLSSSPKPALDQYLAAATGPRANRLAAVTADGSVTPISKFSGGQIWQISYSPDGKWLACIAGTYKRSGLWLFDTTTGVGREATVATPNVLAIDSLAWLSAKELLVAAYTVPPKSTGENADFLIYDPSAQSFSGLQDSGGVPLRGVSVSAARDGSRIAFVTYTDVKTDENGMVTATESLDILDRGSNSITSLGTDRAYFDVNARAFDEPLISPTGDAIIYRRAGSDVSTSYTVIDTNGVTLMSPRETQLPAGYTWDPTGTKVVFTGHSLEPAANSSGIGPALFWLFDTQAGGEAQLIASYKDTMVQNLSWSPDGGTIAWADYDQDKYLSGNVYLMDASGGDSELLLKEALTPVWAPGAAPGLRTSPSPE